MKKLVIDNITGLVENNIVADDNIVIEGKTIVTNIDQADIGDTFDGVNFIRKPTPVIAPDYKSEAKAMLTKNDDVYIRCGKAGVAYSAEWLAYDVALRDIITSGVGPLPTQPAYPAGT